MFRKYAHPHTALQPSIMVNNQVKKQTRKTLRSGIAIPTRSKTLNISDYLTPGNKKGEIPQKSPSQSPPLSLENPSPQTKSPIDLDSSQPSPITPPLTSQPSHNSGSPLLHSPPKPHTPLSVSESNSPSSKKPLTQTKPPTIDLWISPPLGSSQPLRMMK